MEINLNKLLKTYIRGKKRWYKIEYEGLNLVCSKCDGFGHMKEVRSSNKPNNQEECVKTQGSIEKVVNKISDIQDVPEFGPWILITHVPQGRKILNQAAAKTKNSSSLNKVESGF